MSFSRSAASNRSTWQRPARAEQVDLEDQEIAIDLGIQHEIQRRVGGKAAIPIVLAVDDDGGKTRRQGAPDAMICSGPIFLPSFLNLGNRRNT